MMVTKENSGVLPPNLREFIGRVWSKSKPPLVVSFGSYTPKMSANIADLGDSILVGSAIVT